MEAEKDVLPKIRTKIKNERLIIGPKRNTNINTIENLSALEVSGSGDVEAEDISTDELGVTINGSGDVEISGEVESQSVEISGSGDYKGRIWRANRRRSTLEERGQPSQTRVMS